MNVPEIQQVKQSLSKLQNNGVISAWELPYENLLTRLSAAIFFIMPADVSNESSFKELAEELSQFENFSYRTNDEKKLSRLTFRVTFNKEEKERMNQGNESLPV